MLFGLMMVDESAYQPLLCVDLNLIGDQGWELATAKEEENY